MDKWLVAYSLKLGKNMVWYQESSENTAITLHDLLAWYVNLYNLNDFNLVLWNILLFYL